MPLSIIIEQLKEYADKIRAIKGVEEVYFNESTTMFVKIKDFRTISYSYFPEPDESSFETMKQQVAQRVKAATEADEDDIVYSHQGFTDAKLLVVNQQTDRQHSKLSGGVVRSLFQKLGFETDTVNSPDIEFFRNGIFDCDYLFLITHGIYNNEKRRHWVATSVPVERDSKGKLIPSFWEKYKDYSDEFVSFDYDVVIVSEDFINSTSKQFNHPGEGIVFNVACQSMKGPNTNGSDTIDTSFADVFIRKGAGIYLGYDETNWRGQVAGLEFYSKLLMGMSVIHSFSFLTGGLEHENHKKFWADLILYPDNDTFTQRCINRPNISWEDKSDDNGLQIDLHAANLYTYYIHATSYDSWEFINNNSSLSKLPFKYGFELSLSEKFTDIAGRLEKKAGDNELGIPYLEYTESLTYNATESNSMIKPETTYWARAYVYDGSGYNYSEPVTFTTGKYERIDQVIPSDIRDQMEPYINIYDGNNPPNIEGEYIASPLELVYSSQGYSPGDIFADLYFKFYNQNMHNNTLDYREKQSSSEATGAGAFISGEGNNFSVFFNTEGVNHFSDFDINTKTALIVSGTLTEGGIRNMEYAFVMVDKSDDPNHRIIDVGSFRIFHDQDGYSPVSNWSGAKRRVEGYNPTLPSYLDFGK